MNLFNIKDPQFLKELSNTELTELSDEIRSFLIESISKTGGHLASNLGVVELTVALHKVFDTPKDKIVFDVGHQVYTHKILTGRIDGFSSLRKFEGLSGFPKFSESEYDAFETGHSSTSISAASGMVVANEHKNSDAQVVAVIGDGALTGGMAFEAINYFGQSNKKMTIILNDNEMSISNNVGAVSKMLKNLRANKNYISFKNILPKFLKRPFHKVTNAIKYTVEGTNIFQALGYKYYGPIDGHNIPKLIKYLEVAKNSSKPVIIHVKTKKGKGYQPAEDNQIKYHGIGYYEVDNGNTKEGGLSWSVGVSELVNKVVKDPLTVITPAMIHGSGLEVFEDRNLIDVGIAEAHATTMAAGIASQAEKVYLPLYSTFAQRAYDSLLHDIARPNLHVVIGIDRAGIVPNDGDTHQGIFDVSMFKAMPNMIITMPKDLKEAKELLEFGFNKNKNPFVIRYPKGLAIHGETSKEITTPSWILEAIGNSVNIITYGPNVQRIQKLTQENNIDANIVNARFIHPMDESLLDTLFNNKQPILIYEETVHSGSLGQSVKEYILSKGHRNIKHMFIQDIPDHGDIDNLRKVQNLDDVSLVKEMMKLCG